MMDEPERHASSLGATVRAIALGGDGAGDVGLKAKRALVS